MTIAECAVQLVIDNWPSRNAKRRSLHVLSGTLKFATQKKWKRYCRKMGIISLETYKLTAFTDVCWHDYAILSYVHCQ